MPGASSLLRRAFGVTVAVLALSALTSCSTGGDEATTSVFAVDVGDCLNDAGTDGEVDHVPVVDCDEAHDSEVYYEFDATGDMFPSDDDMAAQADEGCSTAFEDFVGVPYGESEYRYASYTPLLASWYEDGGKTISCVIFDPDGQTTGSLRGAGR